MKKFSFLFSLMFLMMGAGSFSAVWGVKIGIILPMHHAALEDIISGFKEKMVGHLTAQDEIIIKNAQADPTLQYQIIQQMEKDQIDYFLPISTSTSLMTLSLIKKRPMIAVAAQISPQDIPSGQSVGVVDDEIDVKIVVDFIKKSLPFVKKIGVIYGNSEKNFAQIKPLQEFCHAQGLTINLRKIDGLPEMMQAAQSVFPEVDAVVILKDNVVVSGLGILVTVAKKYKKLLIAMDDASVKQGAHIALGIPEKEIGAMAAQHLIDALKGNDKQAYCIDTPHSISVFLNESSLTDMKEVMIEQLKKAAISMNFVIKML